MYDEGAAATLDRLIRDASDLDGIRALASELGIEPFPRGADGVDGFRLREDDGVKDSWIIGERSGLLVVVVVFERRVSSDVVARTARRLRAQRPVRPLLLLLVDGGYGRVTFASFGLDGGLRRMTVERHDVRRTEIETLLEMRARPGEGGVALALRHARALDRSRVTRQFFRDVRAHRSHVADAWTGIPAELTSEREQLALLFLCRLVFLYFLQRRGHLAGDPRFLPRRVAEWRRVADDATVFRSVLVPLFFGVFNTRPDARSSAAGRLGPLPYLNGGLFERHALERRFPELDLPDAVTNAVFDRLLERYRFTTREPAEGAADGTDDVGIDPETLGRVFEALMAPGRRGDTGTFYTPAAVVDGLVRETLHTHLRVRHGLGRSQADRILDRADASDLPAAMRSELARRLATVRILDPACGSGAFLVGALARLSRILAALEGRPPRAYRRRLVGHGLFGVDLLDDAALLCALRLWLALTGTGDETPAPLPNLDRRVRQGDALVDPLDVDVVGGRNGSARAASRSDSAVRRARRALVPLAERYLEAGPERKPVLRRSLARAERALAEAWIDALERRLAARARDLRVIAESPDLFGDRPPAADRAERDRGIVQSRLAELADLRDALDDGVRPFFSFAVHFAEAATSGFDIVLSNPPWVRAHRWPDGLRELCRRRYRVCRAGGWRRGAALIGAPVGVGAQVDLSHLFLERSLGLLRPGGTLGMLLPAKSLRSLYGAAARRMLLADTEIASIDDRSLEPGSFFRADAFTVAVVTSRRQATTSSASRTDERRATAGGVPGGNGTAGSRKCGVRIAMHRSGARPLRFSVDSSELPVLPGDPESPWLLAPPDARAAFRRMQAAGTPLAAHARLQVRRGVVTGANRVLVMRSVEPKLGGLASVRAEGHRTARRAGRAAREARGFAGLVEMSALRPLVRGRDIDAWSYHVRRQILWVHDDRTAEPGPAPRRAARYLRRHARALRARSGWRSGLPPGAVFRVTPAMLGPKVLWHDLSDTLKAVAVPDRVRGVDGRPRPLVPLNTIYFVPVEDHDRALTLAAYLNSLPVRTFARALAQRAKDARFRFLAWTVGLVPLPERWDAHPSADRLIEISRAAHADGAIEPDARAALDREVADAYGLTSTDRRGLVAFDRWLSGRDGA